ncbi:MAG: OmpA family protein [Caulobacterales bacterium]|nr:OmpA family protein [Caulobacterales bacterium]
MFRQKCLRSLRPNLRDLSLILSETALAAERELLSSTVQNIIIKRVKKVSGEGHHGGAWKVAYADFVTAMMAFFLLMWLLNATTEDQRKGIADYFNASIPISQVSAGGSGALNGSSLFADEDYARTGSGGVDTVPSSRPEQPDSTKTSLATKQISDEEEGKLRDIEGDLLARALEDDSNSLLQHIQTRMTPDGLVIELTDSDSEPLYSVGSAQPSPTMEKLLEVVASVIGDVTNNVAIVGHTDSLPYSGARDYTNWELSTDRANMARRMMVKAGMNPAQIAQVSGKAATEPLTDDPLAPQNRRISITLLQR